MAASTLLPFSERAPAEGPGGAPKSSHSGRERTFRPNDHFLFDLNFPSESVIKDLNFGSFFMNKRTREGGRILGKSSRTSEEISPTTEIYKRIIF